MHENDENKVVNNFNIVEVENISKVYDKHTWALKKINLKIRRGECISLVGSNGSGKTTLLRILANNLSKTTGSIKYNFKQDNILKAIGFQKREQAWPVGFKVKDITKLWINIYQATDLQWINLIKDVFGITDIENKYLSKLSIIKLQMYALFLAFIPKPELAIIDELSSDIDFKYEEKISNFIKDYIAQGNTVLLNYPSIYFMENATTRIIYINDGEIFDDQSIHNLRKQYSTVMDYTKSIFKEELIVEKRIKNKSKIFIKINEKLDECVTITQQISEEINISHPEEYKMINSVRNIYSAVLDLKTAIDSLSISYIDSPSLKAISKKIKITLKSFRKIYLTSEYKGYYRKFKSIEKYLVKELKHTFNNDMVIIKGDTMNSNLSETEKKQLKKLKDKYIKEELKIIRKKIIKQQFKKIELSPLKKGHKANEV